MPTDSLEAIVTRPGAAPDAPIHAGVWLMKQ